MSLPGLSIVVPVYNEETCLQEHGKKLQYWQNQGIEVVLVDGGSADKTVEIAHGYELTVLHSPRGRATQMNVGAQFCSAKSILFLHIDSQLPRRFLQYVPMMENMPWGYFFLTLDNRAWIYRFVASGINFRSWFFKVATGDQGIFVRADVFDEIGGFPDIALMEDIALSRHLKRRYQPLIVREKIMTSARRWESRGVIKTACLMWFLQLAFKSGVSPDRILRWYR